MEEFVLYEIQLWIDYLDTVYMFWNITILDFLKGSFVIAGVYEAFHLAFTRAREEKE